MNQVSFYVPDLHCGGCVKRFTQGMQPLSEDQFVCDTLKHRVTFKLKNTIAIADLKIKMKAAGFTAYVLIDSEKTQQKERRQYLKRIFVAAMGMMQVMMLSVAIYFQKDMPLSWQQTFHWFSFFLTTPVLLYAGQPYFKNALTALMQRKVNMEVPVALALVIAYSYSVIELFNGGTVLYFDSINMFLFFLTLGRFAEWQARNKTQEASEALWADIPQKVLRVGETDELVNLDEIKIGDQVKVQVGAQIPVDGVIEAGHSLVDESMLTGESQPVSRKVGDTVYAGTVNQTQHLVIKATQVQGSTQLGHIQRLLFEAQESKPAIAQYADKVAGYFIVCLLLLALIVGLFWWWKDSSQMVPILVSLLIVTCPCALSLATPAAIASALARLTSSGILVANGKALEKAQYMSTIVFDKTGTLTTSEFSIEKVHLLPAALQTSITETDVLQIAKALEAQSEHPLGKAFQSLDYFDSNIHADAIQVIPGIGIEGTVQGIIYRLGAVDLLTSEKNALESFPLASACTRLILVNYVTQQPMALYDLRGAVRTNAKQVIERLSEFKIQLLSGDHEDVVASVAEDLGIVHWQSRATPEIKQKLIQQLQQDNQLVMMIGDGVNDGPVLAQADIGIAMGQGTALAKSSADVVLMRDDLESIPVFLRIAEKTNTIIRANMAWAVVYNLIAIPFAAMGLVPPWLAAIGMSTSSLIVVFNSLRLLRA